MQKILIILAAVLSLGATTLGYLNREKLIKERAAKTEALTERDGAKKAMSTTAAEVVDLRASLEKSNSEKTDFQKQVEDKDTELKSTKDKLAKMTSDSEKTAADLALQKTDMEAKDARIAELETKTSKSAQSSDSGATEDLKKKIDEKDVINAGLESKVKDIQSQLSKYKENESRRHANAMKSGLEGRILAVNSAWNFVVLSLGDRDGVINNAEMIIKRGPQRIGKIRITSVEPSTSIADIIANSVRSGLTVQPGDTVIYYGPEDGSDPLKQ